MRRDDVDLVSLVRHRRKITVKNRSKKRLKRPPAPRRPIQYKAAYLKMLYEVINTLRSLTNTILIPRLSTLLSQATKNHPVRSDDLDDDLDEAFDSIDVAFESEWADDELKRKIMLLADGEQAANKKHIQGSVKKVLGIDVFFEEPYLADYITTFAAANVGLITKMKDDALDQISQIVFEGYRSGTRAEDLAEDIQDRFGVAESKANLIARDQMSKLNSGLDRLRQQELGVGRYTWRGVGDNRERDSHLENNDKVFAWEENDNDGEDWDTAPVDTGNPGEDVNCRCYAEPYLADIVSPDESDDSEDQSNDLT